MNSVFPASRIGVAICVVSMLALAGCTSTGSSSSNPAAGRGDDPSRQSAPSTTRPEPGTVTRTGEIYLMRGLMDVFSRGIDVMAAQMRRQGLNAINTSYTEWETLAKDIVRRSKSRDVSYPIVIIGHSLGANDASKMASYLGDRNVKVSYVVTFDPTEPGYYGKNVGRVINYYLPNENNKVYRRKGFKGVMKNIDVSDQPDITHTTVEKDAKLQAGVISRIMKITRKKRRS